MSSTLFVVRLTAIGDCVIAARSVKKLIDAGLDPVFTTSEMCFDIAAAVPGLNRICICSADGKLTLFVRSSGGVGRACFTAEPQFPKFENVTFIDLHRTSRSRRAISQLQKYAENVEGIRRVAKRSFFRWFIIFLTLFVWKQKVRARRFERSQVVRVAALHAQVVDRFILEHGKALPPYAVHLEALPLKSVAGTDFSSRRFVMIAPGASAYLKAWPKEHHRAIIRKVVESTPFDVVLCGGRDEAFLGDYLSFDEPTRVVNLIGKTSLEQVVSLVARSEFVVSADSFVAHIADAFAKNGAMIFGATSPFLGFVPESPTIELFYANLNCSPCTRHGKGHCRYRNLRCLRDISSQDVARSLLERTK